MNRVLWRVTKVLLFLVVVVICIMQLSVLNSPYQSNHPFPVNGKRERETERWPATIICCRPTRGAVSASMLISVTSLICGLSICVYNVLELCTSVTLYAVLDNLY